MFEAEKKREQRSVLLGVKVTPTERQVLDAVAQQAGATLSDVTRMALADFIAKVKTGVNNEAVMQS